MNTLYSTTNLFSDILINLDQVTMFERYDDEQTIVYSTSGQITIRERFDEIVKMFHD
jgi:hypothetical protein